MSHSTVTRFLIVIAKQQITIKLLVNFEIMLKPNLNMYLEGNT